ncbi:MAG: tyrosine-type recombinase/integrase [Saezia sp.]
MATGIGKLSALGVNRLKDVGYYNDGGGLYLQISKLGGKSWVFRFRLNKKKREMGLGAFHTVSLAEAREKALLCRQLIAQGIDPIDDRKTQKAHAAIAASNRKTFSECALAYIDVHKSGWKNEKHAKQWSSTLSTYAFPVIGDLYVETIETDAILRILEPIWLEKTETATRVRNRIELVLDWATARKYRSGGNPARWKAHLDKLLPAKNKVKKVTHFSALPYKEIHTFMKELRQRDGISAKALEFTILTAARSGETRGALWGEIDFTEKLWMIPKERMKAGKEHRIPLTDAAMRILEKMQEIKCVTKTESDFIFPSSKLNKPLSDMSLTAVLKRMDKTDMTVHGFRSTFRDWAGETTHHPREVIEHALAHQLKDKAEAAYQRGDLLTKRRALMEEWARFCC